MRKWTAAFLVCVGILCGGNAAMASCVGSAGLVFNCTPGATPTANDLVLGGSKTGAQNGKVVSWTWSQVFGSTGAPGNLLPLATGTTPGIVQPDQITIGVTDGVFSALRVPSAPGPVAYVPTGTTIVSGQCAQFFGLTAALVPTGAPCGPGGGGGSFSLSDEFGNSIPSVAALTALGAQLSGAGTVASPAVLTPAATRRTVTGTGGSCPVSGIPGPTVNTLCPYDMGGIVVLNGTNQAFTIGPISPALMALFGQTTIVNDAGTPATITSTPQILGYPTTGSGPYVAVLPPLQNGTASAMGLTSDGSTLQNTFALPPGIVFAIGGDQPVSNGFIKAPLDLVPTSGAVVIDVGARDLQRITNNGAMTISTNTNLGSTKLRVTNGASATSLGFTGFQVGSNTGDNYSTCSGCAFDIELDNIASGGAAPSYKISARNAGTSVFAVINTPVTWQGGTTQTSVPVNTSGAKAVLVAESWYSQTGNTGGSLTNSLGDGASYTALGAVQSLGTTSVQMWICIGCLTSTTETFTFTGSSQFTAGVVAFSAPPATPSVDGALVTNGTTGVAPSVQAASKTPSVAGDLFVIAAANVDNGVTPTIDSSFSLPIAVPFNGTYRGLAIGVIVNSGTGALNPTLTYATGSGASPAGMIAVEP